MPSLHAIFLRDRRALCLSLRPLARSSGVPPKYGRIHMPSSLSSSSLSLSHAPEQREGRVALAQLYDSKRVCDDRDDRAAGATSLASLSMFITMYVFLPAGPVMKPCAGGGGGRSGTCASGQPPRTYVYLNCRDSHVPSSRWTGMMSLGILPMATSSSHVWYGTRPPSPLYGGLTLPM